MQKTPRLIFAAPLALAALATSVSANPPSARGAQGEQWQVTSRMSMQGFAAPPQTHSSCAAKDSQEPAGANAEPGCTTSGFKVEGNKTSWHVECAGPPKMSGTGEITRNGADAYSGTIHFSSSDGQMTLQLNGRRVGPCMLNK